MSTRMETAARSLRGDAFDAHCLARVVLDHVTSKWAVLVLVALAEEDQRFSALRRRIGGVTEKMLAQTLGTLEADGFVRREVSAPQASYGLTELGRGLTQHLAGLIDWINTRVGEVPVSD